MKTMSLASVSLPRCRACDAELSDIFVDLGLSPVSNAFIKPQDAARGEVFLPLVARVCRQCWLVQLDRAERPESLFTDDYVYFSSCSKSWVEHARRFCQMARERFGLDSSSLVIEIAANDGYLLQWFVQAGIPCLGIEPTTNTAAAARAKGVPVREVFLSRTTAQALANEGQRADLIVGNNVLAHVPDLHDFVGGLPLLLAAEGVVSFEFPHLMELIRNVQFDTIYHEHYSYLSLTALLPIFRCAGLRVFDVEKLATHGGSLRLFLCHAAAQHTEQPTVAALLAEEQAAGLTTLATYAAFGERVRETKRALLEYLIAAKRENRRIAAYGAAAKGNTLLNYCGVRRDFIDYVADANPAKQGRLLPGTRLPVVAPEEIFRLRPDDLLILPWNLRDEIVEQMAGIRAWGGRFVVPIPHVTVF